METSAPDGAASSNFCSEFEGTNTRTSMALANCRSKIETPPILYKSNKEKFLFFELDRKTRTKTG